jgi:SAM-dependent methyltransferase
MRARSYPSRVADLRTERIAMWSNGDYGALGDAFAPIHERVLDVCEPLRGKALLDVATGTGGVALGAAARGADVAATDFAPAMLARARARMGAASARVELLEADADALPFPDRSFDVVASCFGMVFAPDQEAVAAEVARVCRPGGRLAYTVWLPDDSAALYDGFERAPELEVSTARWSDEAEARALLEPFELEFERVDFAFEADSAEELWAFYAASVPPFRTFLEGLGDVERTAFRSRFDAFFAPEQDGRVRDRGSYLLATGPRTGAA